MTPQCDRPSHLSPMVSKTVSKPILWARGLAALFIVAQSAVVQANPALTHPLSPVTDFNPSDWNPPSDWQAPAIKAKNLKPKPGVPDQRKGASGRDGETSCVLTTDPPFNGTWALVPRNNISVTTVAHPTFYWSVPPTRRGAELEFQLLKSTRPDAAPLYSTRFPAPPAGGIVSLALPKQPNGPGLEVGQSYYWSVVLSCDRLTSAPNSNGLIYPFTSKVQRIEMPPAMAQQLRTARTPEQRAQIYASHGLWLERVRALAPSTCGATPSASRQRWVNLLKSEGLEHLAEIPVLCPQVYRR